MERNQQMQIAQSARPASRRRVFFALWPDASVRSQISQLNQQLPVTEAGCHLIHPDNLHLTLHYIGVVSEDELACLSREVGTLQSASFKLILDHLGYFKRPRVLWLGCRVIPEGYNELLRQLADKIDGCGFKMEMGSTPHVTLRRKVLSAELVTDIEQIEWQVAQFALVQSLSVEGAVRYQLLEKYPLIDAR
jgi:2'-5' RNA ligase